MSTLLNILVAQPRTLLSALPTHDVVIEYDTIDSQRLTRLGLDTYA
jgi:hypothetical protein